jgi:hypothetical protein
LELIWENQAYRIEDNWVSYLTFASSFAGIIQTTLNYQISIFQDYSELM